jgi:hypothetical protein
MDKMESEKYKNLLGRTKNLIRQNEKLIKARKEKFNLFEILSVERREEHTHSAFIAELLNASGSHLLGNKFLNLFLEVLPKPPKDFDAEKYWVEPEQNIGEVYQGSPPKYKDARGGRIDIYLEDHKNNSISIENKIDVGDQPQQLLRYYNHNKGKNTVYYLTLTGHQASEESCCVLKAEEDYYCISYKIHIIQWLELCLKEASGQPILRESIKQYLILIKKLTDTMGKEEDKELTNLILENFESVKVINKNFYKAVYNQRDKIRDKVYERLKEKLGDENYVFEKGGFGKDLQSHIWVTPEKTKDTDIWFCISSFGYGGFIDNDFFIGIVDYGGENKEDIKTRKLFKFDKYEPINFGNLDFIKGTTTKDFYDKLIEEIIDQSLDYIKNNKDRLINEIKTKNEITH